MSNRYPAPNDRSLSVALTCGLFFLALAILFFSINCASSAGTKFAQAGFVAAQVADVHSTHLATSGGQAHEGNQFLPDAWYAQAALKLPVTWGILLATSELERRGHGTAARLVLSACAGAIGLIAARNYQIAGPR